MEPPRRRTPGLLYLAVVLGALFFPAAWQSLYAACAPPPAGLVSWWPGEGNAIDIQGSNNGTFTSPEFAAGEVGQAFSFDGSGNNVRVPASPSMDVGAGAGMTIEAWVYSGDSSAARPIVEWVPPTVGAFGAHFYINQGGAGTLYANLYDTANNSHTIQTVTGLVPTGSFQHVAVTYDKASGVARLFVNGSLATESVLGSFTPQTSPDLSIGYRPSTVPFGPIPFIGRIDEVSLYSRALSTNEIQAIFAAGSAGKCFSAAPSISSQPTNLTVIAGDNASFNVVATGSQPLSYQWTMDGTNLPGATSPSLTLSNVTVADSGDYAVQVTNALGALLSSNAVLTVTVPACAVPPSGLVSWWPAEGNALDITATNNGVTFSGAGFGVGEVGQSFTFNGTSSYVQVQDSPSLSFTNAFTIEFWYKDDGVAPGADAGLVAKRPYSGPCNYGVSITGGNAGSFLVYFLDPNYGSYQSSTFSPLPPPGTWHHLAASYTQTSAEQIEIQSFIDGQLVKTSTLSGSLGRTTNNSPVYFGCSNPPGGEFFKGELDEVSIYDRALSASEVTAIFNARNLGKCPPPEAPFIYIQPTNSTVIVGSSVSLSVGAIGSQPLSYQWLLDGSNLVGATNPVLLLPNVQTNQTGLYSVQVTNSYGSVTSSNALLTVNLPPPCAAPPTGIVSWWPGEGNAKDNEGANNGVFTGPLYGTGEVGQAFSFDGSGNNIRVPASASLNVGAGPGMTIEAWIYSTDNSTGHPIVEWVPNTVGAYGTHFYAHLAAPGVLYANLYDTANNSHIIETSSGVVATNAYQHVAVTYDKASGIARLFVNGAQITQTSLGTFTPQTTPDLSIGYRPNTVPFGPIPFLGKIDEVSLYSRALAPAEIQAIYNAGGSGKCNVPVPPAIYVQPTSQTVTIGQTATFQIQAGGTWPLSYQWNSKGVSIPGATNASLILTNVQMSQAGNYSVQITNAYGSVVSSNATLVVNFPPATVKIVSTSGTAGQVVTVPVVLLANGNENSLGFSLTFPPSLLTNAGVTLGPAALGALLQFNTNQSGAVGVGIALPSGIVFAAGTQEVAEISFVSAVSTTSSSVPLSFGDLPIKRELSDVNANSLAANFTNGQISLARSAFEADVAPRPDGDGAVTIVDWVQVGRYVAALDSPTNASEFQRADCAPRSTLGDGLLTVSDWVQAGRYAAALDPLTVAGGPTTPAASQVLGSRAGKRGGSPNRVLDIQGPLVFQGQTGTVTINLEAQGDENAVGCSLAFDPTVVSYVNYSLGLDAANATIDVNANQATNGQLGLILALPADVSFSPGSRQLVKINFQATTASSVNAPISLTDQPVRREVADTNALPVDATYVNGIIQVNPKPSLTISQGAQFINLSWPLLATNYNLQEATGPLSVTTWTNIPSTPFLTNGAATLNLPLGGSVQFYRLRHQ